MRLESGHEHRGRPSTNGSSHNGSSPLHTNGSTNGIHYDDNEQGIIHSPNFHGHSREEVTRILLQSLADLGYREAATQLSKESGYELEVPSVAAFRVAVLSGEWDDAEALLFGSDHTEEGGVLLENGHTQWQRGRKPSQATNGYDKHGLPLAEGADTVMLRFLIRQQKYLELLEAGDTNSALQVLRHELTPLKRDIARLHALSALMMCSSSADLRARCKWDGADGDSRTQLLSSISKSISPSVMIPEHRLATLLNAVQDEQILRCKYHNTTSRPSLYTDHECAIEDFPLQTLLELRNHTDEVWCLEFSHDGSMLATAGQEGLVTIYDTARWKIIHELRDHDRNTNSTHRKGICQVAFSPDDRYLISCSMTCEFIVTSISDGRVVAQGDTFDEPVCAVAWLPDSETFIIGSQSTPKPLSMYSLKSNSSSMGTTKSNEIYSWREPAKDTKSNDRSSPSFRITALSTSRDGSLMAASTTDGRLMIFHLASKQRTAEWKMNGQVSSIKFSADATQLLINVRNDQVMTIDSTTGEIVKEYKGIKQQEWALKSCFGGAGETFVVSGSEDSSIVIWHRQSGVPIATLVGHARSTVNAVAWHPTNPAIFASAGDDRRVKVWSSANALRSQHDHNGALSSTGLYS